MNPWDFLWTMLGWCALVLVVIGFAILAFACLVILWGFLKSCLPKPDPSRPKFEQERAAIILSMSRAGEMPETKAEAFRAGAEWAWGFQHRKK